MRLESKQAIDHFRKIPVLQGMDLLGDFFRSIGGMHYGRGLKDDFPFVVVLVDQVDGNTGFSISCRFDSFVHKASVHPFSSIIWQQSRMDVDHSLWEGADQI